jgi:RNA polymerase sigma factor (sigma-70 family)
MTPRRVGPCMELAWTVKEVLVAIPTGTEPAGVVDATYRARGRELWAFGRRLGLAPDECDDVLQEAHLRLYTELVRGTAVTDPTAWLYRVLYRLAMDRHRLSRRLSDLIRRWPLAERESIDPTAGYDVWAAIDLLPTRQRAVLYLRYRADLPFDQIAAVMGIEPGAARTAASRGIGRVRSVLTDAEGRDGARGGER